MNRAMQRRLIKVKEKYPDEIEFLRDYERKSVSRIYEIEIQQTFEVLRNNRIGKERAYKIISELYEEV